MRTRTTTYTRLFFAIISTLLIGFSAIADTTHIVKKNESIYGIAYKYNISAEELLKHNPQANQGLRSGMVLTIPDNPKSEFSALESAPVTSDTNIETPAPAASEVSTPATVTPIINEPIAAPASETNLPEEIVEPEPSGTSLVITDVYIAKQGDTFAKIAKTTGLTTDQLIQLNPFIDPDNVIVGTKVRLSENAPEFFDSESDSTVMIDYDTNIIPEQPTDISDEDIMDEDIIDEDIIDEPIADSDRHYNVLVMLPFMAGEENNGRQALQYADFYRGMLLAAKNLTDELSGHEVEIFAQDTRNDRALIAQQLIDASDKDIAVIIAPEDERQLKQIQEYASPKGIYVLNLFNLKDESYATNPYMLHGYISAQTMYDKAIDGMLAEFPDYTPVILAPNNAKAEKEPFVNAVRQRYAQLGQEIIELPFDETLTIDDIDESNLLQPDGKYLFLPKSGSLAVFNRFASAVSDLRARDENPERFATFGYPDWTAFRSETVDILRNLDATIYTRFFFDEKNESTRLLQQEFANWYGTHMREGIPNQAALGYDAASLLINWLQLSNGDLRSMLDGEQTRRGIQSSYCFDHDGDNAGYINQTLYLVRFNKNGQNTVKIL